MGSSKNWPSNDHARKSPEQHHIVCHCPKTLGSREEWSNGSLTGRFSFFPLAGVTHGMAPAVTWYAIGKKTENFGGDISKSLFCVIIGVAHPCPVMPKSSSPVIMVRVENSSQLIDKFRTAFILAGTATSLSKKNETTYLTKSGYRSSNKFW